MVYALAYERIQQYFSTQQLYLQIKKQKLKNEAIKNKDKIDISLIKLSKKDNLFIVLSLLFFQEMILYVKLFTINGRVYKYLFYKRIQDLCCENMFFFILGFSALLRQYIKQEDIPLIIYISTFLSFLSCIIVNSKLYYSRIEKYHLFKKKNFQKFSKLPYQVQLYIANPRKLSILKF